MNRVTLACRPTPDDYGAFFHQWQSMGISGRVNHVTHVQSAAPYSSTSSNVHIRPKTYQGLAKSFKQQPPHGLWVLEDVHVVDNDAALVLAFLRTAIARDLPIHVILSSPSVRALEQWGHYLLPSSDAHWGTLRQEESRLPQEVEYAPNVSMEQLRGWIYQHFLDGDVLIFTSSAYHRDAMVHEMRSMGFSNYPIVPVLDDIPDGQPPRILVGTSNMDFFITPRVISQVEAVIDSGKTFHLRQDTGNDWEEGPITQTIAQRRATYTSSLFPHSRCLRLYECEDALFDHAIAAPRLNVQLCRARILLKCGHEALRDFPVPSLKQVTAKIPLMSLMHLMDVEFPVALIVHQSIFETGSPDLGIAAAAIVARQTHPFPGCHYETCRRVKLGLQVESYIDAWTHQLGRTKETVLETLENAPWARVRPWIEQAYQENLAYKTGIRDLYIHVHTGELVKWRFPDPDCNAILYTRRSAQEIASGIPVHTDQWRLVHKTFSSPLTFVNEVQLRAMESYFHARNVVVSDLRPGTRQVTVWYLEGKEPIEVMDEWMATMTLKALHMPMTLALPGNMMTLIVTAGLRFSDAVSRHDHIVVKYNLPPRTEGERKDLRLRWEHLHALDGTWSHDDNNTLLLPRRNLVEQAWRDTSPSNTKTLTFKNPKNPCRVNIKLRVRNYRGRSTGRAAVQCPYEQWKARIDELWNWRIFPHERLPNLISPWANNTPKAALTTILGIDPTWDEEDVASHLNISATDVCIERPNCFLTHCSHVTDLCNRLKSLGVADIVGQTWCQYPSKVETDLEIPEALVSKVMDEFHALPAMSPTVNQPIRLFWIISVAHGGSPPSKYVKDIPDHQIRIDQSHVTVLDRARLAHAILTAQEDAEAMIPEVLWLPSLVVPWINLEHKNIEQRGPQFSIYGSASQKRVLKDALVRLMNTCARQDEDVFDTCGICLEPKAFFELMICRCKFCVQCLVQYYEYQCLDPTSTQDLTCPNPSCKSLVGVEDLEFLVRADVLEARALRMSTVLSKRIPTIIRHCPAPGCGFIKRAIDHKFPCDHCDQTWCLPCTEHFGTPVAIHRGTCEDTWNVEDIALTRREALKAGAKACPLCATVVVKDGGCNHIACTEPGCLAHWCWKCNKGFTINQNSPPARGLVECVQDEVVTVRVLESTWVTPDKVPCPDVVRYATPQALAMRLDPQADLAVGKEVWVYSYIYDHLDFCVEEK